MAKVTDLRHYRLVRQHRMVRMSAEVEPCGEIVSAGAIIAFCGLPPGHEGLCLVTRERRR